MGGGLKLLHPPRQRATRWGDAASDPRLPEPSLHRAPTALDMHPRRAACWTACTMHACTHAMAATSRRAGCSAAEKGESTPAGCVECAQCRLPCPPSASNPVDLSCVIIAWRRPLAAPDARHPRQNSETAGTVALGGRLVLTVWSSPSTTPSRPR